jgi:hypothetical protein
MPNGEPTSSDAKVLLLLAFDEAGRVQRAHILDAEPVALGGTIRELSISSQQQD